MDDVIKRRMYVRLGAIGAFVCFAAWVSLLTLSWLIIVGVVQRDGLSGAMWLFFLLLSIFSTIAIAPKGKQCQIKL